MSFSDSKTYWSRATLHYYNFTMFCVSPTWTRVTRSTRAANQDRSSQATLATLVMMAMSYKGMFLNVQHRNEKKGSGSTNAAILSLKLPLLFHLKDDADHQKSGAQPEHCGPPTSLHRERCKSPQCVHVALLTFLKLSLRG